jgi:hypothetical protein
MDRPAVPSAGGVAGADADRIVVRGVPRFR